MKKVALLIAAACTLFVGVGMSSTASAYPPGETATLVVEPKIGPPGFTFTATVLNCYPGETVEFRLDGGNLQTTTCDTTTFQATVTYQAPNAIGFYPVTATLLGLPNGPVGFRSAPQRVELPPIGERPLVLADEIQVIDEDVTTTTEAVTTTTAPTGQIPDTGSSGVSTNLTIGGIALLTGLGLLIVAGIRRRSTAGATG